VISPLLLSCFIGEVEKMFSLFHMAGLIFTKISLRAANGFGGVCIYKCYQRLQMDPNIIL